ncbi:DUF2330 domain-containing protein [Mycobacterium asiaticum]|uniref:DUF2330 domain-containing protein n=1 Tax=Mycobacterium asiaticum TaxID=1790 RepID=UPI0007EFB7AF|nr:DUF2330 domain-containing protein [Mycobacterium asiaticum]OBJ57201.1 hypothetical protein A9W94_17485 [Mycobacterium asiaticum]
MALGRVCRLAIVVVVLVAGLTLAVPARACACGAAVAPAGTEASMNREVALVHSDGVTETMLLRLALSAGTDNVALVVPTPAPATVATADAATFTELDRLTAPQIRHQRHWTLAVAPGKGREGAATGARAPEVVSQVRLGPLEATTLAGGDLPGLQKWLADNGYALKPTVLQALDPYVRDGWAFVAIRLTSSKPIVGGLDPVRLTFASSRLVYPMRLSVAAPSAQHVTVFTLAGHRQQRIDSDRGSQATEIQFAGNIAGGVHDALLRELTANHGAYLTKFRVDISRTSTITSDFTFGDAPTDDPYQQVVVINDDVAIPLAAIWLAGFLVTLVVAGLVLAVLRRRNRRRSRAFG